MAARPPAEPSSHATRGADGDASKRTEPEHLELNPDWQPPRGVSPVLDFFGLVITSLVEGSVQVVLPLPESIRGPGGSTPPAMAAVVADFASGRASTAGRGDVATVTTTLSLDFLGGVAAESRRMIAEGERVATRGSNVFVAGDVRVGDAVLARTSSWWSTVDPDRASRSGRPPSRRPSAPAEPPRAMPCPPSRPVAPELDPERSPLARSLGLRLLGADEGEAEVELGRTPLVRNTRGVLHGGTAALLAQLTGDAALHTVASPSAVVPLTLTARYERPAGTDDDAIRCRARVVRLTRRIATVRAVVRAADGRVGVAGAYTAALEAT